MGQRYWNKAYFPGLLWENACQTSALSAIYDDNMAPVYFNLPLLVLHQTTFPFRPHKGSLKESIWATWDLGEQKAICQRKVLWSQSKHFFLIVHMVPNRVHSWGVVRVRGPSARGGGSGEDRTKQERARSRCRTGTHTGLDVWLHIIHGLGRSQRCHHPWSERAETVEDDSKALSHLTLSCGDGQGLTFAGGGEVGIIV